MTRRQPLSHNWAERRRGKSIDRQSPHLGIRVSSDGCGGVTIALSMLVASTPTRLPLNLSRRSAKHLRNRAAFRGLQAPRPGISSSKSGRRRFGQVTPTVMAVRLCSIRLSTARDSGARQVARQDNPWLRIGVASSFTHSDAVGGSILALGRPLAPGLPISWKSTPARAGTLHASVPVPVPLVLGRRRPDEAAGVPQPFGLSSVAAYPEATIDWRFATTDARIRLKRRYPAILP